jgi:hypothetical protein
MRLVDGDGVSRRDLFFAATNREQQRRAERAVPRPTPEISKGLGHG